MNIYNNFLNLITIYIKRELWFVITFVISMIYMYLHIVDIFSITSYYIFDSLFI